MPRPFHVFLLSLALALTIGFPASSLRADTGPRADLWERWEAHDPGSTRAVDHAAFDAFLETYRVVGPEGVALIRYGAVSTEDARALDRYLRGLEATAVSALNRDEQFAYWVNLYNAATIDLILDHYPLDSILDVPIGGLFSFGPWGEEILEVEGEAISLDDIEHRILRPIWRDARIHYAVNCASIGCPNIAPTAFTAQRIEEMLDAGARAYVNHPRAARVTDGALIVSSIYVWFESDFIREDGGVLAHLRRHADPGLTDSLRGVERIADDAYDWSLNDAATLRPGG